MNGSTKMARCVTPATTGLRPKVSVAMITYNHEKYIARAVESVLQQETPFPIELVIGEDCSRDRTKEIVQKYAAAHPQLITPLFHTPNMGMHRNHRAVVAACRGEFIAFLEGDDYWTSPLKLVRQVELLDRHQSAAGSFHRVVLIDEHDGSMGVIRPPETVRELTTNDLLVANSLDTCSVMVRRALVRPLPAEFDRLPMADWPTWILASLHGPFVSVAGTMAAYRIHGGGVWSSLACEKQIRATLHHYHLLSKHLDKDFRPQLARCIKDLLERLIFHLASQGRWAETRPLALRYLLFRPRPSASRVTFHLRLLLGWPSKEMLKLADTRHRDRAEQGLLSSSPGSS